MHACSQSPAAAAAALAQDITPRDTVRLNPKCDRDVALYGFLRGTNLKPSSRVHIAGVGDYSIQVCVRVCVRACVRACVCVCVGVYMYVAWLASCPPCRNSTCLLLDTRDGTCGCS
jgi:hypothetical protein